ncbi:DUF2304 domain-containing protein [Pasteurella skyensis]|uniref:DUF2304 domain-containing protein n=1 Tax=Phocoenobacter skyensis TaxID=97481 RepID=A0AAJ6N7V5_9PAST|nr:DUF2304 domain-containing protein [Pasteurella skyensis]MDP8161670.1 DUF2304 domain-containing protein [Pasteurella skyensis]MDP8171826.1 DUF2304 domain-containing protein [Pasteurella skyensis]MDP8176063.1 DUF2304 domain-containing protein [Pasteurella skyensis]MDP8178081.1 DUF2304 domain-containing protein [Pasteurella skyensis]MDP8182311.1 DUF2304 domain-containing protein [Pasteurella skyensis]
MDDFDWIHAHLNGIIGYVWTLIGGSVTGYVFKRYKEKYSRTTDNHWRSLRTWSIVFWICLLILSYFYNTSLVSYLQMGGVIFYIYVFFYHFNKIKQVYETQFQNIRQKNQKIYDRTERVERECRLKIDQIIQDRKQLEVKIRELTEEQDSYKQLGFVSIKTKAKTETDYQDDLNRVESDFKFLGVGGDKLTSQIEHFEKAMCRASKYGYHPIRFLLCHSDSGALKDIAAKKGETEEALSNKIRGSLRKMAYLKQYRSINIQVRFYKANEEYESPIFRLMFLNNSTSKSCLVNYRYFGGRDHRGEELPQLEVVPVDGQMGSFYWAFDEMFNRLWEENENNEWDHEEFLR